ncbi:MAG: co-chaperone GroES [Candidatus Margulisbacteria bacterium]|nr:co-chaperone GroES [Candidatus Margulisiibacteriota bacterium]
MKFKPLGDRVIIEPESAEKTTESGIVLPESAQEKPQTGKVVSIGTGRVTEDGKNVPISVKEGDVVIYAKYGGTEIKMENKDYVFLKSDDILAVQS